MNNDVNNENIVDKMKLEKKFIQISPESIEVIADSAGYPNLSTILAKSLAEDSTYRLRELIQNCSQILRHNKRTRLTKDDVNLALHWSDVPQIHGPTTAHEDFLYLPEFDIYSPLERQIDLSQEYPTDTDVEVYSSMKLSVLYLPLDSEDKHKNEIYAQYFEKVAQSLLSTSESVVEVALNNLQENAKLQPLLPTFSVFLKNLVEFSSENCHVVTRIPRIFDALMKNPNLHVESEHKNFVKLLQELLLNYGGPKLDQENFHLVSSVSHIIAQLSVDSIIHEVVGNLSNVIAGEDYHISIQCKALIALRCLSSKYLDKATMEHWNSLLKKFHDIVEIDKNELYLEHALQSAAIRVLRHKMRLLDGVANKSSTEAEKMWNEGAEVYRLTNELIGSSVVRIGEFPFPLCQQVLRGRHEQSGELCNELYWTMKTLRKPVPRTKWQYNKNEKPVHIQRKSIDLADVFDYPNKNGFRVPSINIRVRNWKQRPVQLLKKRVPMRVGGLPSSFALLSNAKFRPFSKCFLANTVLQFHCSTDMIL